MKQIGRPKRKSLQNKNNPQQKTYKNIMKKIFMLLAGVLTAGMLFAQEPVIEYDKTEHDFGKINEADGRVTTVFTFKNSGMTPLVLNNVRASCGCTTPKWTKEPVEPGKEGQITVTYNPNGRPGHFNKTITVTSNAKTSTTKLHIKGEVIPKSVKPVDKFPVKMGALGLVTDVMDFGDVKKGAITTNTIGYANQQAEPITLACRNTVDYVFGVPAANAERLDQQYTIEKDKKGDLQLTFDANMFPTYGPMEEKIYLVIDGKEDPKHVITIRANVVEDFSKMTEEQLANAPIVTMANELNLGTFKKGKKAKATFHISNAGQDMLLIHRIIADYDGMTINAAKSVRSGKRGNFTVNFTPTEAGTYELPVTVITNDPKQSVKKVTMRWSVE